MDNYTTLVPVLRQAGLYIYKEALVSELDNTGLTYAVATNQLLDTQDYYLLSGSTRTKLEVDVDVDANTFTVKNALKSTDRVRYPSTSAILDEVNEAIDRATKQINATLTDYDKDSNVLERIAIWLAAGFIKSKESGYLTQGGDFVNEGNEMIKRAEMWLKMELKRQMSDGDYSYGDAEVVDTQVSLRDDGSYDDSTRC